jgi:hypothetical protein
MTLLEDNTLVDSLSLPYEDRREHALLLHEWLTAFPGAAPIERGYIEQAVTALIEKRRLARIRATARTQKVRTGLLEYERDRELEIAKCRLHFDVHCPSAAMALRSDAAGCRWLLNYLGGLAIELGKHGTLHGESRSGLLQTLGYSGRWDELFASEEAYTIWMDCLGAMPNPRTCDVDRMLDPACVPPGFLERDLVQWPRDPAECRGRLKAVLDREIHQLRDREEAFRLAYEQPERADAPVMALARPSREDMNLIRAERIHEQSYHQAVTALMRVRKQAAAAPRPAPPARDEGLVHVSPLNPGPGPRSSLDPPFGRGDDCYHRHHFIVVARSCDGARGDGRPDGRGPWRGQEARAEL